MYYKLVDTDYKSFGSCCWKNGPLYVTHMESGGVDGECGPGWLHVYADPILGVMMDPIHANVGTGRILEVECLDATYLNGGKYICRAVTPVREIKWPLLDMEHRIRMALYCSMAVCSCVDYLSWAESYLEGNKLTLRRSGGGEEGEEAINSRVYAWKAALYEDTARCAALAVLSAERAGLMGLTDYAYRAWGRSRSDAIVEGSNIGGAFNQRTK